VPISEKSAELIKESDVTVVFNVRSVQPGLHDKFSGSEGSFMRLMRSLILCLSYDIPVQISFVPTRYNYPDIAQLVSFSQAMSSVGIKQVNVLRLVNQGRAADSGLFMTVDEEDDFVDLARRPSCVNINLGAPFNHLLPARRQKPCSLKDKIVVTPDGVILPCEAFKGNKDWFVGPTTIEDAIKSMPFQYQISVRPLKHGPFRCPVHHSDIWP
jgi:MoaA/NifB/PqqE/SkfB family radical SAM enzyme